MTLDSQLRNFKRCKAKGREESNGLTPIKKLDLVRSYLCDRPITSMDEKNSECLRVAEPAKRCNYIIYTVFCVLEQKKKIHPLLRPYTPSLFAFSLPFPQFLGSFPSEFYSYYLCTWEFFLSSSSTKLNRMACSTIWFSNSTIGFVTRRDERTFGIDPESVFESLLEG